MFQTSFDSRKDASTKVPCRECGKPTWEFTAILMRGRKPQCHDCYLLMLAKDEHRRRGKICTGIYNGPRWRLWVWERVMALRWWLEHTAEPWLARVENYWGGE